jgi:predicted transposase YbfD/YdcC
MGKLKKLFRKVRDPRASNAQHELLEILVIAFAAMLCGAEGASDMARFGRAKAGLLRQFLRLEHGIPSHDTFSRVFRMLDPKAFEQAFRQFMLAFARFNRIDLGGVIAIDGKSLRGAYERGKSATPMHLVNAFAAEARMALASCKAPGRNETEAALQVLRTLSLKHSIVTADALFCSRPFAKAVLAEDGDYVLALKKNQSKLFAAVVRRFAQAGPRSTAQQLEPSTHDRRERRRATVIRDKDLAIAEKFPGIVAIGRITSRRRRHGAKAEKPTTRYFLLSTYLSAKRLLAIVRSHWSIENQLHWMLDVILREDNDRTRKDSAPENLAVLRKLALNLLRAHPDKMSTRQKIKAAGWDDSFLLSLIGHMQ